jgi:hypothetical protein
MRKGCKLHVKDFYPDGSPDSLECCIHTVSRSNIAEIAIALTNSNSIRRRRDLDSRVQHKTSLKVYQDKVSGEFIGIF